MHASGPGRRPAIFNGRVVPAALPSRSPSLRISAAQTIAPPPPKPAAEQEPVVLTPFTVGPESNQGYLAGSSLTGSRMATDILDIAALTTAFTEQFFIDLGAFTMADMSQYMVSTEFDYGESSGVQNVINEDGRALRIRGPARADGHDQFLHTSVNNVRWDMFSMDRSIRRAARTPCSSASARPAASRISRPSRRSSAPAACASRWPAARITGCARSST